MRELIVAPEADREIDEVLRNLSQYSTRAAVRLSTAIDRRSEQLRTLPLIGRTRDELSPGLRSIVLGDHLLFYRVTDAAVEVVRFLHGRHDLPAAFASR